MLRHLDISTNCSSSWTVTLHKQFVNCQCIVYFGLELSSAKQKANIAVGWGREGRQAGRKRGMTLLHSPPHSLRTIYAVRCDRCARGYCDVYWGQVPVNLPGSATRTRVALGSSSSPSSSSSALFQLLVHIKRLFALNCKRNELVHTHTQRRETVRQRQRLSGKLMSWGGRRKSRLTDEWNEDIAQNRPGCLAGISRSSGDRVPIQLSVLRWHSNDSDSTRLDLLFANVCTVYANQ